MALPVSCVVASSLSNAVSGFRAATSAVGRSKVATSFGGSAVWSSTSRMTTWMRRIDPSSVRASDGLCYHIQQNLTQDLFALTKKVASAQEVLILLTDVAHNLLAWTTPWMFPSGPLAQMGATQMIQDVLCMPGRLIFERRQLVEVQLNQLHPYASEVAAGLVRLLDHFGYP